MKLSEDPDEVFVLKAEESTEETKTVIVEIHDFSKRIDDLVNKKKPIDGPKFKVGGKELSIQIYPEDWHDDSSIYIGVYLRNHNKEKIKPSFILKHESGVKKAFENQEINVGKGTISNSDLGS